MKLLQKVYLALTALSFAFYAGIGVVAFIWASGGIDSSVAWDVLGQLGVRSGISLSTIVTMALIGSVIYYIRINLVKAFIEQKRKWADKFWNIFFIFDVIGGLLFILITKSIIDLLIIIVGWYLLYLYVFKKKFSTEYEIQV